MDQEFLMGIKIKLNNVYRRLYDIDLYNFSKKDLQYIAREINKAINVKNNSLNKIDKIKRITIWQNASDLYWDIKKRFMDPLRGISNIFKYADPNELIDYVPNSIDDKIGFVKKCFDRMRIDRYVDSDKKEARYTLEGHHESGRFNSIIKQDSILSNNDLSIIVDNNNNEYFDNIINADKENNILDGDDTNKVMYYFNNLMMNGVIYELIYNIFNKDDRIKSFYSQALYLYRGIDSRDEKGIKTIQGVKYGEARLINMNNKNNNFRPVAASDDDSMTESICIGYRILIVTRSNVKMKKSTINDLKAFNPSNNIKYHKLTTSTTGNYRLCIYESFLDCIGIRELKFRRQNDKNEKSLTDMLKKEGKEIENNVREGNLIKSLKLLTKKYDKCIDLYFFKNNANDLNEDDIRINRGKITKITGEKEYGKKVLLYCKKDKHVGVSVLSKISQNKTKIIDKKIKKDLFILRPRYVKKDFPNDYNVLGFDFETYNDMNNKAIPYCATIYGKLYGNIISKKFYGDKCVDDFVNYLIYIRTKKNHSKTNARKKIPDIFIYGFNNSNFDNLLFYKNLHDKIHYCKIQFAGNSIKFIKFDNMYIYDISLFYKRNNLRDTCKLFMLEEEKGVFPYMFPNKDNLNYIGKIPDVKYWNSEDEYNEYLTKNGDNFNLEEYTIKYCLLDSKLVYGLAEKHLESCTGTINNRRYNVTKCPTAANVSLKLYIQSFLEDNLVQSPDDIVEKEKIAYKGGRTEVFKKSFDISKNNNKPMIYSDINSSYPFSMTKKVPYKYLGMVNYRDEEERMKKKHLKDYYLYRARAIYCGDDKYHIPNLMCREKDGSLSVKKNTEYSYHWGVELKEAIKNGYKIYVTEIMEYEGKEIFKEFSNYFYNERLKVKNTNIALAMFYKSVLNSLYGKFGQKLFNNMMLTDPDEIYNILNNDSIMLKSFQEVDDKLLISYIEGGDDRVSIGRLVRFSSYIAALSRTKLAEVMRSVGHKHVYYCDTDSVFTDKEIDKKYLDNNKLGYWKVEAEISEAIFLGKKFYTYKTIDGKRSKACKGVSASQIGDDEYRKLLNGEIESVSLEKKMFFRSFNGIKIEDKSREVKPIYNKRIWEGNESMSY